MLNNFTLEYWIDDGWYVGKIKEIPEVLSEGETLEELKENIQDAYKMIMKEKQTNGLVDQSTYPSLTDNGLIIIAEDLFLELDRRETENKIIH